MRPLTTPRLVLRPVQDGDHEALAQVRRTPEVSRWWGPLTDLETEGLSVLLDGRVIGLVQFDEEEEPNYRHAGIDLYLSPDLHGSGLGAEVVHAVARHLIEERGHHRLTIDPAADNAVAIACYRKVGFRPVGVMRQYERDGWTGRWRDGLLMDLLAAELLEP